MEPIFFLPVLEFSIMLLYYILTCRHEIETYNGTELNNLNSVYNGDCGRKCVFIVLRIC